MTQSEVWEIFTFPGYDTGPKSIGDNHTGLIRKLVTHGVGEEEDYYHQRRIIVLAHLAGAKEVLRGRTAKHVVGN